GAPSVSTGTRPTASTMSDPNRLGSNQKPPPARTAMSPAAADQGQQKDSTQEQGKQAADQAKQAAGQAIDKAGEKAGQVAGQAGAAADQGIHKAAEGLDQAADMIREKGKQVGPGTGVQTSVVMVADKLDAASGYLRGKDSDQLVADLEALVRRKPTESLLVAAVVGFFLSKVLR
ncbi:MAG: hypothetical protein M3509_05420, partial [Chloroflexota bacterium]|nr:hypothetical protein [Chloroflexota bacterium]